MTRENIRNWFIQKITSDYAADEEDPFLTLSPENQENVCLAEEFEFDSLEKILFMQTMEKEFKVKFPQENTEEFLKLPIGKQIDEILAKLSD